MILLRRSLPRRLATIARAYSTVKNPYASLGLSKDASASEIKRAYFDLVKKYHPDSNKDPSAKGKFMEVQEAYDILSDPQKKATYDRYGVADEQAAYQQQQQPDFNGGFDASSIFENLFGRGAAGGMGFDIFGRQSTASRHDAEVTVSLDFLEAVNGCSKVLAFNRLEACAPCSGSGVAAGSKLVNCKTCRGSGQETRTRGGMIFYTTCRSCQGEGKLNTNPCGACAGNGAVERRATVEVQIPAGVTEETVLTIPGGGVGPGTKSLTGDLYIRFSIAKSPIFERRRNDIYVNVPIDLYTAVCGGVVRVPTINGEVELKVPAGTQPEDLKKMTGRGVPVTNANGERGNQYVRLKVELPKQITEQQRELLKAFLYPPAETASAKEEKQQQEQEEQKPWYSKLFGSEEAGQKKHSS